MWSAASTVILGAVGAFISWQQWRIAEIRLRHDLYERRFRVYMAAKMLLITFQDTGKITQADYFTYVGGIADAEFMIDDQNVIQYLQTLRNRAIELIRLRGQEPAKAADALAELEGWFMSQFDVLRSKFRPVLSLHAASPWRRIKSWVGIHGPPGRGT
jgi:hypothetical protein